MIQDLVPNINLNNLSEPNENVQSDPNNEHLKDEFRSLLNAISKENDHGNTSSIDQVKEIKNSSISHFQHREDSLKNEHVISNYEIEDEANDISLSNVERLIANNDIEEGSILSSNIELNLENNDVAIIKSKEQAEDEIVKSEKDISKNFSANEISLSNVERLIANNDIEEGSILPSNIKLNLENNDVAIVNSEEEAKDEIVKSEKDISKNFKANSLSLPNAEALIVNNNSEDVGSEDGFEIVGKANKDGTYSINKISENTSLKMAKTTVNIELQRKDESSDTSKNFKTIVSQKEEATQNNSDNTNAFKTLSSNKRTEIVNQSQKLESLTQDKSASTEYETQTAIIAKRGNQNPKISNPGVLSETEEQLKFTGNSKKNISTEVVSVQKQGQSSIIADNNDSSLNKKLLENENLSTNFKKDISPDLVKREKVVNPSVSKEYTNTYTKNTDTSVATNINQSGTDERSVKIETDSKNPSKGSLKLNLSESVENIEIVNKSIFKTASVDTPSTEDVQKVIRPKDNQSKQLFVNALGEQKTPLSNISDNLNVEIFKKPLVIQKGDIALKSTIQFDQHSTSQSNIVFQDVSEVKSSELVQFIQANKSEIIPLKDAKKTKYALSMSEQGEARLKLLKESERIDVLSSRDMKIGEYTSHTLDKKIQFFNSTVGLSNEQEAMLKELMLESFRGENQNVKETNLLGYLRLSELPIINASARRALTSNFAKILQQDMSASLKHNSEKWQKHSFRLEDGNNINMTSKNIDGILHIKLAASNPELNRLLMSMEQEIREHLKEELSLELDLQFENREQGAFSDALGNNSDEGNKNWNRKESEITDDNSNQRTVNSLESSIRNFGYNQMEWTA